VGTKYLFWTLARVINEINTVASQMSSAKKEGKEDQESGPSLLDINMEVISNFFIENEKNLFFVKRSTVIIVFVPLLKDWTCDWIHTGRSFESWSR
jgi:hypothetical protein